MKYFYKTDYFKIIILIIKVFLFNINILIKFMKLFKIYLFKIIILNIFKIL